MRVISLVPSWTETLIEAGINVIGRTRFCVHPVAAVKNIAVVGGTKNIDIEKIVQLKPDIVILDKEENTLEISRLLTEHNIIWHATHVLNITTCAEALEELSRIFDSNKKLKEWSKNYFDLLKIKTLNLGINNLENKKVNYVIWKSPWMCAGANTFIGDVLACFQIVLDTQSDKYFKITEAELKNSYCLFSSEPYPFKKEINNLQADGFSGELINGESISWFGVRNLKFMLLS